MVLPAWLGAGTALKEITSSDTGLNQLREMREHWPDTFEQLLENVRHGALQRLRGWDGGSHSRDAQADCL